MRTICFFSKIRFRSFAYNIKKNTDHIEDKLKQSKSGILTGKVIQLLSVSVCRMSFRVLDWTTQTLFLQKQTKLFEHDWTLLSWKDKVQCSV